MRNRARVLERTVLMIGFACYYAMLPVKIVLFRGRIRASGRVKVSIRVWNRVRRSGSVAIGAGAHVQTWEFGAIEGRFEIGPDVTIRRAERIQIFREGIMRVGARSVIDTGARIIVLGDLTLGDDVYLGRDVLISAHEKVTIGSGTLLGERVSIHDENHGPAGARQSFLTSPVVVGEQAWIGAGVVLVAGSSVGKGTTVGANATVTRDLPAEVLAGGVPAKVIKTIQPPSSLQAVFGDRP